MAQKHKEAQHVIGKDLAKSMELMFGEIFDNNPEKMDIIRNTKLFKFFNGSHKVTIPNHRPFIYKLEPTEARSKILLDLAMKQYEYTGIMDFTEYNSLKAMIESEDSENRVLAEEIIALRISPKFRSFLQKLKRRQKNEKEKTNTTCS